MIKQISLFALIFISTLLLAQQAILKGKIIDNTQRPLEGVEIQVNNKDYKSNSLGNFSIPISSDSDIIVTVFLEGYLPFETVINNRPTNI